MLETWLWPKGLSIGHSSPTTNMELLWACSAFWIMKWRKYQLITTPIMLSIISENVQGGLSWWTSWPPSSHFWCTASMFHCVYYAGFMYLDISGTDWDWYDITSIRGWNKHVSERASWFHGMNFYAYYGQWSVLLSLYRLNWWHNTHLLIEK